MKYYSIKMFRKKIKNRWNIQEAGATGSSPEAKIRQFFLYFESY